MTFGFTKCLFSVLNTDKVGIILWRIMIKLKSKKIIGGLLLIVVLMTTFQNMIYAVSMNQRILIDNYGKCDYTLQYKKANGIWSYVTCTLVGYSENG